MEDYRVRYRDGGYNRERASVYPREQHQEHRNGGYNREKASAYPGEYRGNRDGGYNHEKAGVLYPGENRGYRDGGHNHEKAGVYPGEYRGHKDGGYNHEKVGVYPGEYPGHRDGGYNHEKAGAYPGEHKEYRDGSGHNHVKSVVYPKDYQEYRDGGYNHEKDGLYPVEYREYENSGYNRVEYTEYIDHSDEKKHPFDFSPHDRVLKSVVRKVEEYVYPPPIYKHEHKLSPREDEKHKGFRRREEKVFEGADLDENRRNDIKAKPNPLKVSKWGKNDNVGNKIGHNYEYNNVLENKEPPSMITDGGWTRPNRTMWASPPVEKTPDGTVSDALEYLKLAAAKTDNPRYRSTVGVPMRPHSAGYDVKPPAPEVDAYRGSIEYREPPQRRYGGGVRE